MAQSQLYCKRCRFQGVDTDDLRHHKLKAMAEYVFGTRAYDKKKGERCRHLFCEFCGEEFKNKQTREIHRQKDHTAYHPAFCKATKRLHDGREIICGKKFECGSHLLRHYERGQCRAITTKDFQRLREQKIVNRHMFNDDDFFIGYIQYSKKFLEYQETGYVTKKLAAAMDLAMRKKEREQIRHDGNMAVDAQGRPLAMTVPVDANTTVVRRPHTSEAITAAKVQLAEYRISEWDPPDDLTIAGAEESDQSDRQVSSPFSAADDHSSDDSRATSPLSAASQTEFELKLCDDDNDQDDDDETVDDPNKDIEKIICGTFWWHPDHADFEPDFFWQPDMEKWACALCTWHETHSRVELEDHIRFHFRLHPNMCFTCPNRFDATFKVIQHFESSARNESKAWCGRDDDYYRKRELKSYLDEISGGLLGLWEPSGDDLSPIWGWKLVDGVPTKMADVKEGDGVEVRVFEGLDPKLQDPKKYKLYTLEDHEEAW